MKSVLLFVAGAALMAPTPALSLAWPLARMGPDGRWLATGGSRGVVQLWEVSSGKLLSTLDGKFVGGDGRWLAAGGDDNTARLWHLRD